MMMSCVGFEVYKFSEPPLRVSKNFRSPPLNIFIRPQRRHGGIYELNSKADELKQFVQFLAVLKAILKEKISAV